MNLEELTQAERIVYAEALTVIVTNDPKTFVSGGWYGTYDIEWDTVAAVLFASEQQKQKAFNIAKGIERMYDTK